MKKNIASGFTTKQRVIALYLAISFFSLFVSDETPFWIILIIVLNFSNAVRLSKQIPVT